MEKALKEGREGGRKRKRKEGGIMEGRKSEKRRKESLQVKKKKKANIKQQSPKQIAVRCETERATLENKLAFGKGHFESNFKSLQKL